VLVISFITTGAWWPLLNLIKVTRNPYLLGLLKFIFYLDNFGMLLSWVSARALAQGEEPDLEELVKMATWILLVLILMEIPIILSAIWSG
jgi:hypothetical protein